MINNIIAPDLLIIFRKRFIVAALQQNSDTISNVDSPIRMNQIIIGRDNKPSKFITHAQKEEKIENSRVSST